MFKGLHLVTPTTPAGSKDDFLLVCAGILNLSEGVIDNPIDYKVYKIPLAHHRRITRIVLKWHFHDTCRSLTEYENLHFNM